MLYYLYRPSITVHPQLSSPSLSTLHDQDMQIYMTNWFCKVHNLLIFVVFQYVDSDFSGFKIMQITIVWVALKCCRFYFINIVVNNNNGATILKSTEYRKSTIDFDVFFVTYSITPKRLQRKRFFQTKRRRKTIRIDSHSLF